MIKQTFLASLLVLAATSFSLQARDTLFVKEHTTPLLINRANNIFFDMSVTPSSAGQTLKDITLELSDTQYVKSLSVYYSGTRNMANEPNYGGEYLKSTYSVKKSETSKIAKELTLQVDQELFGAKNYFFVTITLDPKTPINHRVGISVKSAEVTGEGTDVVYSGTGEKRRMGVSVRNAGQDGSSAYRIPGLVTSKKGTLLAVYDIRRNNSADLQEDVQVGLSRSLDGGQSWEPMQTVIDMRGYGLLPDSQNGVGDPAILVDDNNGDIYIIGLWAHGLGGKRNFWGSPRNAMTPEEQAAQVLIVKSSDDGKTWSEPINISEQVRDSRWGVMLQGPGTGITMKDGTLVFAFQYVDYDDFPKAAIIYSKDQGKSWQTSKPVRVNTTEAQVAELEDGRLMINMRDNRGGSRAIYTTDDMGESWSEHPSSRSALIEPVCMASFIKVDDNRYLFSNPAHTKSRVNMTIKGSDDRANSWNSGVLLDSGASWGYSSLTMVDPQTVGILYEGSQAQMTFQVVPLDEIFAK